MYKHVDGHGDRMFLKKPKHLEASRAAVSIHDIERYMDMLKAWQDAHHYLPSLIINFDETWSNKPYRGSKSSVLVSRPDVVPIQSTEEETEHITVGVAIAASGALLTPQVIVNLKHLPDELNCRHSNFPYNAFFSYSEKGWANQVFL